MEEKGKDLVSNLCPLTLVGKAAFFTPDGFAFRIVLGKTAPLFYVKTHLKIENNNAKFQINGKRIFS